MMKTFTHTQPQPQQHPQNVEWECYA